jgi:hypothetical protein
MMDGDDPLRPGPGPLPPDGIRVELDDLVVLIDAIRALIDGSWPDEPNRAHILTVAFIIAEAVDRGGR